MRSLAGVGAVRAAALQAAGVRTVWDLLHRLPRLAPPPPPICTHGPLPCGIAIRVRAQVVAVGGGFRRGRGRTVEVRLRREQGEALRARFFNAAWLASKLTPGAWYRWEGRTDQHGRCLLQPRFHSAPADADAGEPAVRMRYGEVAGFSADGYAALLTQALDHHLPALADPLRELAPPAYQQLIATAHRPPDAVAWQDAVRELARRELRALAWRLSELMPHAARAPGRSWTWSVAGERAARARLPFALSPGQEAALAELRADMQSAGAMCRLLQGEVGSGKTAVAFLALMAVLEDGAQGLVLAPTALLAEQHARWFQERLATSRFRCALITGALGASARAALLARAAAGDIDLVVGTHALLSDELVLPCLGLVIIDEQHRFGVGQRVAALAPATRRQGFQPDLLLMSATPIPRTLALTIYGGMPMTVLHGRPPGHAAVTTRLHALPSASAVVELVAAALAGDGRAFVVCARKWATGSDLAAVAVHARLDAEAAWAGQVALVHGDCSAEERTQAMDAFRSGRARVLVATTLIEVGVDIPEASHLIVLEPERFGLAQLHQLRGRLGRGHLPGTCVLAIGADAAAAGSPARARLELLAATTDGLAISEADLRERGAGELLGTLQHGVTDLLIADLARDLDLLTEAHAAVRQARLTGLSCPAELAAFVTHGALPQLMP